MAPKILKSAPQAGDDNCQEQKVIVDEPFTSLREQQMMGKPQGGWETEEGEP